MKKKIQKLSRKEQKERNEQFVKNLLIEKKEKAKLKRNIEFYSENTEGLTKKEITYVKRVINGQREYKKRFHSKIGGPLSIYPPQFIKDYLIPMAKQNGFGKDWKTYERFGNNREQAKEWLRTEILKWSITNTTYETFLEKLEENDGIITIVYENGKKKVVNLNEAHFILDNFNKEVFDIGGHFWKLKIEYSNMFTVASIYLPNIKNFDELEPSEQKDRMSDFDFFIGFSSLNENKKKKK